MVVITFVSECVQLTMGRPCKGDKPLSDGERSKAYRDRKKGEKSEEWKEMRKEVKKKSFDSLSKEQEDKIKRKDRERKKASREAAKLKKQKTVKPKYKTPAALGKAKSKVLKALPDDPERAQEVVDGIKRMLDKKVGARVEEVQQSPASKVRVELRNKIATFYYRTDISVTFAGRKDYVMV